MNISDALNSVAGIFLLFFVYFVFMSARRFSENKPASMLGAMAVVMLLCSLGLTAAASGLVFVEPDQLGVVITAVGEGGIRPEPLPAGLHWILPYVERVERYSILRQTYTMSSLAGEGAVKGDDSIQVRTKDGQLVYIEASVLYQINTKQAVSLYKTWRNGFVDGLVRPLSRGIIRDVATKYSADEIVSTKREDMQFEVTEQLNKVFEDNHLVLLELVIRNIRFTEGYTAAVEQKQVAEQQALQARLVVESKRQEAEQARQTAQGEADAAVILAKGQAEARLIQAKAEAEALEMLAGVLKDNPSLLTYQYINKLAPNIQVMLVPSSSPFLLPLPSPAVPQ